MKRIKAIWQSLWADVDTRVRLGRIMGLGFITLGFVLIGVAWNGAASRNFVTGQFPYLLSGGFMGLGLIATGVALLFLATVRAERQLLTAKFDEMATLLARNLGRLQHSSNGSSPREQVVATGGSYHRDDCTVLHGKTDLATITPEMAEAEGLSPCRVCDPPRPLKTEESAPA